MSPLLHLVLTATLTVCVTSGYKSYSGYQVVRTRQLLTWHDVGALTRLLNSQTDARFMEWQHPMVGRSALVMTAPQHVHELRHELDKLGLPADVFIEDVETLLQKERSAIDELRAGSQLDGNVTFERYMELFEIEEYMDQLAATFPELVSLIDIGSSYEGRPLRVIKISSDKYNSAGRPGVFMDAAIHAREWLGPPVALHVAHQLTTLAAENQDMLELADWYILPVANPDGYVYTWTTDRFWRKNRRENKDTNCAGVDLNRNFAIEWQDGHSNPCLFSYRGSEPTSEPETKAMSKFMTKFPGHLALYMAIHSYSTLLLHPYGYSKHSVPDFVVNAAKNSAAAIEAVRGTKFQIGSFADFLYYAYGTSTDFAYDMAGVSYSYIWELPAGGEDGFDPPPSDIRPVVEEMWQGFKVLAKEACNNARRS